MTFGPKPAAVRCHALVEGWSSFERLRLMIEQRSSAGSRARYCGTGWWYLGSDVHLDAPDLASLGACALVVDSVRVTGEADPRVLAHTGEGPCSLQDWRTTAGLGGRMLQVVDRVVDDEVHLDPLLNRPSAFDPTEPDLSLLGQRSSLCPLVESWRYVGTEIMRWDLSRWVITSRSGSLALWDRDRPARPVLEADSESGHRQIERELFRREIEPRLQGCVLDGARFAALLPSHRSVLVAHVSSDGRTASVLQPRSEVPGAPFTEWVGPANGLEATLAGGIAEASVKIEAIASAAAIRAAGRRPEDVRLAGAFGKLTYATDITPIPDHVGRRLNDTMAFAASLVL